MPLLFPSDEELRRLSACNAEAARALHGLVKDTRRVIEDTESLLKSPIWARMDVRSLGQPQQEKAPPETEGAESFA
jgi:hypothetical protein